MTTPADLAVLAVGLTIALFGFEIQSRVRSRLGVDVYDDGAAGHALKWIPPAVLVALVLFVEGESLASIGWRFEGPATFAVRSAVGLAAMFGANVLTQPLWARIGDGGEGMAEGMASFAALSVPERLFVAATAGVTEEVTYKGYAIERLAAVSGSPLFAGGVSFAAFTVGHYSDTWGAQAVLRIAQPALITTALYLWFRSLPVLIVVHAANDAVGLLLADWFVEDGEGSVGEVPDPEAGAAE